jgi:hypothetical protein
LGEQVVNVVDDYNMILVEPEPLALDVVELLEDDKRPDNEQNGHSELEDDKSAPKDERPPALAGQGRAFKNIRMFE